MTLEVDNIELHFKTKRILYGIYLKAESGKITSLIGRNGCSKTSLLKIVFGSLDPKSKSIRIDGTPQPKPLFLSNQIAYLPQHRLLPKSIKTRTAFKLFNCDFNGFTNRFTAFDKYYNYRVSELSSGERKVMETYLILFSGKRIILLDEPFSFVAPIYVEIFKRLMLEQKKDSLIMVTDHFYHDVLAISDTTYCLKNGCSKPMSSREGLEQEGYLINHKRG